MSVMVYRNRYRPNVRQAILSPKWIWTMPIFDWNNRHDHNGDDSQWRDHPGLVMKFLVIPLLFCNGKFINLNQSFVKWNKILFFFWICWNRWMCVLFYLFLIVFPCDWHKNSFKKIRKIVFLVIDFDCF